MATPLGWFPFYVDAYETDEAVKRMTYEQRGIFIAMLCWQWREGSLPKRSADVAKALSVRSADVQRILRLSFVDDGTGAERAINPKMAEVRAHQLGKSGKARIAAQRSVEKRRANAEQSLNERSRNAAQSSRSRVESIRSSLSARADETTTTAPAIP